MSGSAPRNLQPGDADYDGARQIWNGMFDKKPALIARCRGTADVIDAVNFARENGLLTAVRCGGHNSSGSGSCDGGILIDLSAMNAVHVDPKTRRARIRFFAKSSLLDVSDHCTPTPWLSVSMHDGVGAQHMSHACGLAHGGHDGHTEEPTAGRVVGQAQVLDRVCCWLAPAPRLRPQQVGRALGSLRSTAPAYP